MHTAILVCVPNEQETFIKLNKDETMQIRSKDIILVLNREKFK